MITFKEALEAAKQGEVMIGLSYLPHRQLVTIFEIRRAGETVTMRSSKGTLFGDDRVQIDIGENDEIIKLIRFKPLAGKVDVISMPVELAAYTFFMPNLPHPYGSDRQGYKGHFAGSLACMA